MTKRLSLLAVVVVSLAGGLRSASAHRVHDVHRAASTPIYQDRSYSFEERAADLVSRMTLAEKASQMVSSQAPAIPRLGIPAYGWWNEALHGVARLQLLTGVNATVLTNTTSYPIDLSLGSSWDPSLMYREASAISDEAREVAPDNALDLDFYSPTINLARDPRWGRNDETFSEDPLLTAAIAGQFVNGMEGKDQNGELLPAGAGYLKTITTIKHYAANNSEINRRSGSSDMDERTLREYYTNQFKRIVEAAHPGSIMSSYNEVNGVPAAANVELLDRLARQTFGFGGYFTSDCDAIFEMVRSHHWQPPGWTRPINNTERHAFALSAGEDLDCNQGYHDAFSYLTSVPTAVGQGIKTQADTFNEGDVDTSLVRLFTARMKLGEFDDVDSEPWVTAARSRVAQGSWTNSDTNNAVTQTPARLDLAREVGDKTQVLLKNASTTRKDGSTGKLLPLHVPASGPFKVAVIGYFAHPDSLYLGGYSSNQGSPGIAKQVDPYTGLKSAIQAVNPGAQVDFYKGFTGIGTTGDALTTVDPAAVDAAASYDDVIVYAGTDRSTAAEDTDRLTLALPGAQADLINQVAAKNPNTIAVMETIGQVDVTGFEPNVASMLWSSYNGQRKGDALADVLLGSHNPSARLPFIWYRSVSEIPDITDYAIRPSGAKPGRTYMYFKGPLSYPFGYGLSYTDFTDSNMHIDHSDLDANDTFRARIDVTNRGAVKGDDVVQFYVSTPDAPAALERPIKRLVGFQRVSLEPGETKTVTLPVKVPDLAFWDEAQDRYAVDDGRYGVQIATSSADGDIQAEDFVHVRGRLNPAVKTITVKPTMEGDAERDIASRVMFPEGAEVTPEVTVALSDESLYGYIAKGQSKPLPKGMAVTYRSNRPGVVSVDRHGAIHTVANGVATITATATYGRVRRSTTFVVRVLSELGSLRVGGRSVKGFQPDTFRYDVIVPDRATSPPRVKATAPSDVTDVSVTQAGAVPGQATVRATGPDGVALTYTVSFAHPARSDEFSAATLGSLWSWVRHNAANESLTSTPGSLTITPEAGDLTGATNTAKNVLLQSAPGDWRIESKLTFSAAPHADNQQGGILAYQDDDNYLRLGWEWSAGAARLAETTEDSLSGTPIAQVLANVPTAAILGSGTTVWLRMVKKGPIYTSSYSTDGSTFSPIYTTGASLSNVKVGLFAFNRAGTNSELNVGFDSFHVRNARAAPRRRP